MQGLADGSRLRNDSQPHNAEIKGYIRILPGLRRRLSGCPLSRNECSKNSPDLWQVRRTGNGTRGEQEHGQEREQSILLGNVGKDPEIRSTPGGTMVANFTLATSDRFQDAQGNWQDRTEWHNLVAFKRTAEIVRDYVKKGSKLYIEGKIQTRSWEDKETRAKRYRTEIIVNDLSLLSGRDDRRAGAGTAGRRVLRTAGSQ